MSTEPLDCPFCGSVNIVREGFHMTCFHCGCNGPDGDHGRNDASAIEAWNRRAAASMAPQEKAE